MSDSKYSQLYPQALIIEDEIDTCLLLSMLLKKFGISSVKVHSLEEGYKHIVTDTPPLIFLDNNLPDGTGIERIQQFKQQIPSGKLVMMTAMSALRERALALGVDGFIEKPLNLQKIESVLGTD